MKKNENLVCFDSQSLFSFNHGLDSVIHILDKVNFGESESSLVGDIENTITALRVLSVDSSNLDVILVSNLLELFLVLGKFWQLDVDGGSQSGSAVGWAGSQISKVVIVGKLGDSFDFLLGSSQSIEDGSDITTGLHGDDSELIFFIDPDEESLIIIVIDSSSSWPVSVESTSLQESVTFLEQEMVCNELFSLSISEFSEWVIFSLKISIVIHG